MARPSHRSFLVLGIAGIAAFVFLWQLGSSSFFLDEAGYVEAANGPPSRLWHEVRLTGSNPPAFFLLLHVWTRLLGSDAEWAVRLPSALAGIALVFAVYRLGALVGGKRTALVAALLTAVSPLILQYAQQARVYTLATLACMLAVIAVLHAERRPTWAWTLAGAACAALAVSLHYFAAFVVAPLCLWVLLRRELETRMRLAFCAIVGITWLAWIPLFAMQLSDNRAADLGEFGTLTKGHAVRVLGAPFDDRYSTEVGFLKVAAACVIVSAVVWAAVHSRGAEREDLRLIVGLVLASVAAVTIGALAGKEIFNSRYVTFVAPLMLVIAAAAIARAPRPVGVGMLGVLLAAGLAGVVGSHRTSGFYPDTRHTVDVVAANLRPGDVVLHVASFGTWVPLEYYARRRLPKGTPVLSFFDPASRRLLRARPRVWIVRDQVTGGASGPSPPGYRTTAVWRFPATLDITLVLELPRAH